MSSGFAFHPPATRTVDLPQGHPYPGLFVELEGPDGAGKGLLLENLLGWLPQHAPANQRITTVREPGGTEISEDIRELIRAAGARASGHTNLLLFSAARRELVERSLRPELEQGALVVSDRYYMSTYIYQGLLQGVPLEEVANVTAIATQGIHPDLRIVLRAPPAVLKERTERRGGPDAWDQATQESARAYEWLAEHATGIECIDASLPPEAVLEQAGTAILRELARQPRPEPTSKNPASVNPGRRTRPRR